jgi:hypothetical protein
MTARPHRNCSGVVKTLPMYTYLVSDIFFFTIIKIFNYSLHSSLGPPEGQAQPFRHAAAIDADSEAYRRGDILLTTSMWVPCSVFPLTSRICALKILSKASESWFGRMNIAAKETTGVDLTKHSQLRGGFRSSGFHWV